MESFARSSEVVKRSIAFFGGVLDPFCRARAIVRGTAWFKQTSPDVHENLIREIQ